MTKTIITTIIATILGLVVIVSALPEDKPEIDMSLSEARSLYMEGCDDGSGDFTAFCSCTFDEMAEEHGIRGIYEVGMEMEKTGGYPDELLEAVIACEDRAIWED